MTTFDHIAPRISYFGVYEKSIAEAVRFAAENGFTGVQLPVEVPHFRFDSLTAQEAADIRSLKDELGIRVILHAHDDTASLWEGNKSLQKGIREYYLRLLEIARSLDTQLVTVHLGSRPQYGTDSEPRLLVPPEDEREYASVLRANLDYLVSVNSGRTVLCIENYRMDAAIPGELQPYLDAGTLSLCWDFAKTYDSDMNVIQNTEDYFWRNVRHVRQVHLHDKKAHGYSHLVPGTGSIDFAKYLSHLSEESVLDYCIEVRPGEKARESLESLRKMFG